MKWNKKNANETMEEIVSIIQHSVLTIYKLSVLIMKFQLI